VGKRRSARRLRLRRKGGSDGEEKEEEWKKIK
jgi:hypothetical protein